MQIEFFYDYGSPYSYLADALLPALAARHGVALQHRPLLLGAVFKATGNRSPMQEPTLAKRRYGGAQLQRTAALHGIAFAPNPHFPINTLAVMRLAVAAQRENVFETFHRALYPAFWQRGLDLGARAVQEAVINDAGLDAQKLLRRAAADDAVKAELRANTEEAVERGVFGAPTCFVGAQMFFGVDHLPHLEHALRERSFATRAGA